ncbi:modulator of smoothened protein-like [Styela clava]|uniref:modulator of smoothened protein-like n=1 Tax=Styela clava TaxID=7725 RepID=UPI00193A6671|nr:modulator of smoothened protein-like [Styela clava]
MDKLTIISGVLFVTAEVFAVASLGHPDWINTGGRAGDITLGLTMQCQTIYGRKQSCFAPDLPPEWLGTRLFLVAGIVCLGITCLLVVSSHWKRDRLIYARWMAFIAIGCLSYVGMLFPIGFRQVTVGGEAFKLPELWRLGDSYKLLWVFSIILSCSGWGMLMMPMRLWMMNRN